MTVGLADVSAQIDKRDVRRGNRDFKKENFKEAELDYFRALVKDSLSFAANYNMANALYRQENYDQALKHLEKIAEMAVDSPAAADYYYNLGNVAMAKEDYQKAVDAYKQSLLRNPADLDAKENYIYAKEKLKQQQEQQQNQQNDQDQNQNNQNDQNQDQDQNNDDQNKNNDQNQYQNQDEQDQNNDQNKNGQDKDQQDKQNQQGQEPKISPQAAKQMLQAIQAKEKETQEKVNKEKAAALSSRQKEKNW
jgi:tetratricopeptide (TPR) repeat protein